MNQAAELSSLDTDDLAHVSGGVSVFLRMMQVHPGVKMMQAMMGAAERMGGGGLRYDHMNAGSLFGDVSHTHVKYITNHFHFPPS